MGKQDEAAAIMAEGRGNCAQAVLAVYAGELGLETAAAFRLAQGLGAGMGRTGGLCGAVSAAIMIIGLKTPQEDDFAVQREHVYARVQDYTRRFIARHRSINCTELLGYNLGIPPERAEARRQGVTDRVCPAMVTSSIDILEEVFNEART